MPFWNTINNRAIYQTFTASTKLFWFNQIHVCLCIDWKKKTVTCYAVASLVSVSFSFGFSIVVFMVAATDTLMIVCYNSQTQRQMFFLVEPKFKFIVVDDLPISVKIIRLSFGFYHNMRLICKNTLAGIKQFLFFRQQLKQYGYLYQHNSIDMDVEV